MEHASWIKDLLIFLAIAGMIVPFMRRFQLGTVPAFLVAGVLFGPNGLGKLAGDLPLLGTITFTTSERVAPFAELGVLFLLFVIGLELSARRLWSMRREVFGLGAAQVLLTGAAIGAVAFAFGDRLEVALVVGLAFSFASTAIVMPVLAEAGRWQGPVGRTTFAVLIFQDLAVVPIVMLVGILGGGDDQTGAFLHIVRDFGAASGAVAAIVVAGHYLLHPLLRAAAKTGSRELVVAIALFTAIAAGLLTAAAGMSPALGAFLGGLLLGRSEFRHQLEIDMEPFKSLLLGLFFVTVGMSLDTGLVVQIPVAILVSVAGLLLLKAGIVIALCLAFGIALPVALETGLVIAGCGEFVFVVLNLAGSGGLIAPERLPFLNTVAVLTMLVTPLLGAVARRGGDRVGDKLAQRREDEREVPELSEGHVIIGGFGRVGRTIARSLEASGIDYIAVDTDVETVNAGRAEGKPVHYGDVSRIELLDRMGGAGAGRFVLTANDPGKVGRAVRAIRGRWPDAQIYARARDEDDAQAIRSLGATEAVAEAMPAALQLSETVLRAINVPDEVIRNCLAQLAGESRPKAPE